MKGFLSINKSTDQQIEKYLNRVWKARVDNCSDDHSMEPLKAI
ncbi:MAG: hypothetical protein QM762_30410 [Chryseolinea sp.]